MKREVKIESAVRGGDAMRGATVTVNYLITDNNSARKGSLVIATTKVPDLEEIKARVEGAVAREEALAREQREEKKALEALKGATWTFDV